MNQQLPLFEPDTAWEPPAELPQLRGQVVALDTEEKDDSLAADMGPGWVYGAGYTCGVSVAWAGSAHYIPLRHPDTVNFDREQVSVWLRDLVAHNHIVFQNAPYDIGWLWADLGVPAPVSFDDTKLMAVMLDENRLSYDLNSICRWLGIEGKDEAGLWEAASAFGLSGQDKRGRPRRKMTTRQVKSGLWTLPARHVGPYAEQDAVATLAARQIMLPRLQADGVVAAYELDRDLVPMVVEMRRRGIRVDLDHAAALAREFEAARDRSLAELTHHMTIGRSVTMGDINSPRFLEQTFSDAGIKFPRTPRGQGSFQADWMRHVEHWLPQCVVRASRYDEIANKFIRNYIIGFAHRGRVHSEVHLYRSEEGGTRSHRFSYSQPPLQQMPSRDREARLIRTCFLPEPGCVWTKADYSQQEYRLIVHFAHKLKQARADEAVALYRGDRATDFHALVADWTGLDRKSAKDANFGKAFGAGVRKFASMIGRSEEEAREIYNRYDTDLPFVNGAAKRAQGLAQERGYIRLIDGARCRFDRWEAAWREQGEVWEALGLEAARARWPGRRLRRADCSKAFNRAVQGSAARQTKLAMRQCWREGIVPMLQMHDELDTSVSSDAQVGRIREIMETVVTLEVPVVADIKVGLTWGSTGARRPGAVDRWARLQPPGSLAGSASALAGSSGARR